MDYLRGGNTLTLWGCRTVEVHPLELRATTPFDLSGNPAVPTTEKKIEKIAKKSEKGIDNQNTM